MIKKRTAYSIGILAAILAFFVLTGKVNAQEERVQHFKYDYAVSGDIFGLLTHHCFTATYERQLNDVASVTGFMEIYALSQTEFGFGASYRFYAKVIPDKKKLIESFSFGPFAAIVFREGGSFFEIGPEVAYKYVTQNISIEPLIRFYFFVGDQGKNNHTVIGLNVNLGYAW